jgi:uncharacterized phage protein (predicted DNA packaging)
VAILDDVKASLRIDGTADDDLLTRLIASASQECAQYVYGELPDYLAIDAVDDPQTVPLLKQGIILMVQSDYEGDPTKRNDYLAAAKSIWNTHRTAWGV